MQDKSVRVHFWQKRLVLLRNNFVIFVSVKLKVTKIKQSRTEFVAKIVYT